jgi:hypothetical protein
MKLVKYLIVGLVIFAVFLIVIPDNKKPVELEIKPSIYITRTDRVLTLGGETVWILEYTVDGRFEAPAFTSREAMAEYREYLDTIGTVYRRKEE